MLYSYSLVNHTLNLLFLYCFKFSSKTIVKFFFPIFFFLSSDTRRLFLIFCLSSFFDNFIVKNNFLEPWNQQSTKLTYLKTWSFKQNFCTLFWRSYLHKLAGKKNFFRKKFISRTWKSFRDFSATDLGLIFFRKKLIWYFFQVWLFNFNIALKTCLKNLFGKLWKNGDLQATLISYFPN